MTGKIKLNAASGGGSVSFQAPSSTGDDRIITLPTTADGTVLTTTNPKSGNIIQVVQTHVSTSSSITIGATGTYYDTPASITVTSTAANSKFKISGQVSCEINGSDHDFGISMRRVIGGTTSLINIGTGGGGSQHHITRTLSVGIGGSFDNDSTTSSTVLSPFLDSPSQASGTAITYKFSILALGGSPSWTAYFNRVVSEANDSGDERTVSYILVEEVAA